MRKIPILILVISLCSASCSKKDYNIFIEAESFSNKGGWIIDPQFVEQMGSPYLIAHGLGKPVPDAETMIPVQQKGKYHIWVRTMNWSPGEWDAPGTFKVIVGGKELKDKLGTDVGWKWQYAGKTFIEDSLILIGLHDMTGFDGRCDAIFLNTKKSLLRMSRMNLHFGEKSSLVKAIFLKKLFHSILLLSGAVLPAVLHR